ncbi:phage tail tape measure protein [Streptomyces sp. WM4235]|uniref:phage tail tape measure protein n=1 Tax=Streptomyces sp. WM4235 TaxID=1415551 RepID=UPI0006AF791A|nr:phage tail tape measure protein [Streptomyces sp. WM4235]
MPNVGYATIQIIPSVRGIANELRSQLEGPAEDAGEDAGAAAGSSLKEKLLVGVAAAGVAAGAILVAGITEAIEQANITSTLQAQLGATGKDAGRYGEIAGKLYSKGITESFQEGADAIRAVVNAGLVPPDATNAQLESLSAKMSDVATVFGADMELQTQAVSAMFKNGLAPNAEAALDLITVGFQKLGPNAEDLLETFQEYSIQFKKLGIDGEEALGLFQQGIAAGARDTDIIADAFKEFGIRAIDMSESSQEAYKAIGLDAEKMSLQIAKGGDVAGEGLQTVLDKLREIKDPVDRNAAAVGLFGTQAEDLGNALFALDPNGAIDGFGKITGAAAELGTTIHSGPAHEFEVFVRTIKQGFVDYITAEVLPLVLRVAKAFNSDLLPPIRAVASAVAAVLMPALRDLYAAGTAVVNWLREWGVWLIPAAILVGGLTLALNAQAIAIGAVTAVFSIYRAAILLGTAVTSGFTAVQALLNAVMALNPITLVVIALVALAAALVIAYKKSETFRAVVAAVWQGIQTAAIWVWEKGIKPLIDGFMVGLRAVGDAATWLWKTILEPVFSGIGAAAQVLLTIVLTLVFLPMFFIFKLFGALAMWLWKVAIKPAFEGIAAAAVWMWETVIKPLFDAFVFGIKGLGLIATWLWKAAIQPAFKGIAAGAEWMWRNAVKPLVDAFVFGLKGLGIAAMWLWTNAIKPAWDGIGDAIRWVWNNWIKPAFDGLKRGVDAVHTSFRAGVAGIEMIWNKLKDITRKPVQFIVDTVYNNGIRKVWGAVSEVTGADPLPLVKFKDGGRTRGGTPGKDSIPLLAMADEFMVKRDSARKVGYGTLEYINRYGALPGYKDGGVIGWAKDKVSSVGDFFGDMADLITNPGKAWQAATGFIRDKIASISGTGWGKLIAGIPTKILSSLKEKITGLIGNFGGGDIGGSGVQRWTPVVLQALQLIGQPASMLATTLRRMNQESGGNPRAINNWDINAKNGVPSKGLMQVIDPTFDAYAGPLHSRGIWDPLANIYASMSYALGRYHSLPAAYDRAGGYDSGGWLQPGVTAAVNRTGRPEAILTGPQWQAVSSLAAGGGFAPGQEVTLVVQDGPTLRAYVDGRADRRIIDIGRQQLQATRAGRNGV